MTYQTVFLHHGIEELWVEAGVEAIITSISPTDSPADEYVKKATFVTRWMKKYGDSRFVSEKMYDKINLNTDDVLTNADIPLFYALVDKNKNGIEWAEFEKVYIEWYNELQ